jgi:hypothetical protein
LIPHHLPSPSRSIPSIHQSHCNLHPPISESIISSGNRRHTVYLRILYSTIANCLPGQSCVSTPLLPSVSPIPGTAHHCLVIYSRGHPTLSTRPQLVAVVAVVNSGSRSAFQSIFLASHLFARPVLSGFLCAQLTAAVSSTIRRPAVLPPRRTDLDLGTCYLLRTAARATASPPSTFFGFYSELSSVISPLLLPARLVLAVRLLPPIALFWCHV